MTFLIHFCQTPVLGKGVGVDFTFFNVTTNSLQLQLTKTNKKTLFFHGKEYIRGVKFGNLNFLLTKKCCQTLKLGKKVRVDLTFVI